MQTATTMAKDKTFNLRLDEQDRARLDMLSAHYSAPAATVVRILIKEKVDWLETERRRQGRPGMPLDFLLRTQLFAGPQKPSAILGWFSPADHRGRRVSDRREDQEPASSFV